MTRRYYVPGTDETDLKKVIMSLQQTAGVVFAMREPLTANRTYYVRTDGSDSNDGLSNSASGAFATIQKAVDVVYGTLDLNGYDVTIQLGNAGTYTGAVEVDSAQVGAGNIDLAGDVTPANTGNYIVTSASGTGTIYVHELGTRFRIKGFELRNSAAGGLNVLGGAFVRITGFMRWGACTGYHMRANGSQISGEAATWAVVGDATIHMQASPFGFINIAGATIQIPAATTVAFGTAFALADRVSLLSALSATISNLGTVTGKRYEATLNSVIYTNGGGASFFPGDVAGTTATGGQYA